MGALHTRLSFVMNQCFIDLSNSIWPIWLVQIWWCWLKKLKQCTLAIHCNFYVVIGRLGDTWFKWFSYHSICLMASHYSSMFVHMLKRKMFWWWQTTNHLCILPDMMVNCHLVYTIPLFCFSYYFLASNWSSMFFYLKLHRSERIHVEWSIIKIQWINN